MANDLKADEHKPPSGLRQWLDRWAVKLAVLALGLSFLLYAYNSHLGRQAAIEESRLEDRRHNEQIKTLEKIFGERGEQLNRVEAGIKRLERRANHAKP